MTDIDITNTEVAASLRRMRELTVGEILHPDLDEPDTDTRDASPEEETLIGEITRLRTALTASLAREAAAFEAAVFVHERLYKAKFPACSYHHADIKAAVKALTPADAQAALQAMIDAAVKEVRDGDAAKLEVAASAIKAARFTFVEMLDYDEKSVMVEGLDRALAKIGGAL